MSSNASRWSPYETLQLIKTLKKYPYLYNKALPEYTKQDKRKAAYVKMARALRKVRPAVTAGDVVLKLQALLAQAKREVKRRNDFEATPSNAGSKYVSLLWCHNKIKYLIDAVEENQSLPPRRSAANRRARTPSRGRRPYARSLSTQRRRASEEVPEKGDFLAGMAVGDFVSAAPQPPPAQQYDLYSELPSTSAASAFFRSVSTSVPHFNFSNTHMEENARMNGLMLGNVGSSPTANIQQPLEKPK